MQRFVLSLLLGLLLGSVSGASDKEEGVSDAAAMHWQGTAAALRGEYVKAIEWYLKAGKLGDASALYAVGNIYLNGAPGVPQDYIAAARWYRLAAEKGYSQAQVGLGLMFSKGQGVSQNYAEAVRWYRKAAEQRYTDAQALLGGMYFAGEGVPQDYVTAHMWYNLAAAQGDATARLQRDDLAKLMTSAQIAEAQRLAQEWHKAHTE